MQMVDAEKKYGLSSAIIMGLGGAIGFEIFVLLNYAAAHYSLN